MMVSADAPHSTGSTDWDHIRKIGRTHTPGAPGWPDGVHPISLDGIMLVGVDESGLLYWDGKPVEVRRRLDLTRGERVFALIVGIFTILGSIGAVAQGWAAAHQWACQTAIVVKGCPGSK